MEALGPWHLLIVAAVFVVLFGAKRLPDAARSLGRSARILKAELHETRRSDTPAVPTAPLVPPVQTVPAASPLVPPVQTVPAASPLVPPVQTVPAASPLVPPVRTVESPVRSATSTSQI